MALSLLAVTVAHLGVGLGNFDIPARVAYYAFPLVAVCAIYLRGGYRRPLRPVFLDQLGPLLGALAVAALLLLLAMLVLEPGTRAGPLVVKVWLLGMASVLLLHAGATVAQRAGRRRGLVAQRALIVGAGLVGSHIARRLMERPEYGLQPIGFLDAQAAPPSIVPGRRLPILGHPDDLLDVVRQTGADHVILAFSTESDRRLLPVVRTCLAANLSLSLVPRFFDAVSDRVELQHVGGLPLYAMRAVNPAGWQFAVKHSLDRVGAALALLLLAPAMLAVAAAVRVTSPGPILFRQRRVGRDGCVFELLKFRTMRVADDHAPGFRPGTGAAPGGVEGIDRRTPIGRWLRRTSVDELPQLINVLRGEMSLIGPRPERPEFVELFHRDIERYGERHRVRAGITGWAQVHGFRGQTSIADRAEWDNFYIENWSLVLDFKIALLSLWTPFRRIPEP
ncbi:MAG TPA: sugar transferase [Solirubrobacteraceae bacterium]|nr:sugar transferase [Solirubrobacteraceae bacterium]